MPTQKRGGNGLGGPRKENNQVTALLRTAVEELKGVGEEEDGLDSLALGFIGCRYTQLHLVGKGGKASRPQLASVAVTSARLNAWIDLESGLG